MLINTAGKLGGHTVAYGDVAVTVNAFNRIPVTIVLWQGYEEFPSQGEMLFNAAISNYLSTYDIAVLCKNIL